MPVFTTALGVISYKKNYIGMVYCFLPVGKSQLTLKMMKNGGYHYIWIAS